jgi:nicotinate phosphoribosyltransferase
MMHPSAASVSSGPQSLLVDLYDLTMGESYLAEGLAGQTATFQMSCRRLPQGWGYLLGAGIDALLDALEAFRFDGPMLAFLETTGLFGGGFLEHLADFRFRGEVRAMPEGTIFFADEPLVELTATLLEGQLVETTVLNGLNFPSLVAAKAARCVDAAAGRGLVDFSLRRTHGADAGLRVARGSYLAGFDSTSNVLAGSIYGIPVSGTMAHSYVESFVEESAAFEAFTRSYPDGATLLIDTYDTLTGARRAAAAAQALRERGGRLSGVRLDSGDLLALSRAVRALLDEAGLPEVVIVASGDLDEHAIARLVSAGAPIDGFGVGTRLGVAADAPSLEAAYKLVCVDGRPVMKLSPGKQSLPASKQVWRRHADGRFVGDLIALRGEPAPPGAVALLAPVMAHGVRLGSGSLEAARARAAEQRSALAPRHRGLDPEPYPVEISPGLSALAERLAAEVAVLPSAPPR